MALNTSTKAALDKVLGPGGAAKLIALNASGTALDGPTRNQLAHVMGGIGEATAFEALLSGANGAVTFTVANMQRLNHALRGFGGVVDLAANGNA